MKTPFYRQIAVLGAGTMGAQIAAHFANANIAVYLFDLPAKKNNPNEIATLAIANLAKINPEPLAIATAQDLIIACNYQQDLDKLKKCDLIIEAVVEKTEIKTQLYKQIAPYLHDAAIVASNTSGLSINALAKALPTKIRKRFMGMHFFNPPRYLPLVELISHKTTDSQVVDAVETFLTSVLGKSIVRAKDTPNFIANRIGVFAILAVCHHAERFEIPLEVVDDLTGKRIGRPKSATFRTADLVGLDVLAHTADTLRHNLPASDPWAAFYAMPKWISQLIKTGALGQKTQKGIYQKTEKGILVLDLKTHQYRPATQKADKAVTSVLKEPDIKKRFRKLRSMTHPQAQFLWAVFCDIWHYSAVVAQEIADNIRDIDHAMRLGFGWSEGPFETWQKIGWKPVTQWLQASVQSQQTMAKQVLPQWVSRIAGPYQRDKAYQLTTGKFNKRRRLSIDDKQVSPILLLKETRNEGTTLFENDSARLWTHGDGITILSFKTKMCTINDAVLAAIQTSLQITAADHQAMVIYQVDAEHFSAGADLLGFAEKYMLDGVEGLKPSLELFQQAMLAIRYAPIPVVAAIKGYVLGGGCELQMHCDQTVAALESYVGLVEVGVGIIPGAGGTKEMTLRASKMPDPEKALQAHFKQIAMAEVAKSALQAKAVHYLRDTDIVIFNPNELLYVAKLQARCLAEASYRPPLALPITVEGESAKATIQWYVMNLYQGGFISEFDYFIVMKLAHIMTGGGVDRHTVVDERWLLGLEREAFLSLVDDQRTQERMEYLLTTGKPLRN